MNQSENHGRDDQDEDKASAPSQVRHKKSTVQDLFPKGDEDEKYDPDKGFHGKLGSPVNLAATYGDDYEENDGTADKAQRHADEAFLFTCGKGSEA